MLMLLAAGLALAAGLHLSCGADVAHETASDDRGPGVAERHRP